MKILDIFEDSFENLKVAPGDRSELDVAQDFADMLTSKKNFEGNINSIVKLQQFLDSLKKFQEESKEKGFGADKLSRMKYRLLEKCGKRAPEIQKILDKVKNKKNVSEEESEKLLDFIDDSESILFDETYVSQLARSDTGGSGGEVNKIVFNHSFPIKYTSENGKTCYGIVRPPTGIITWQGEDARNTVSADKELALPKKISLMKNKWTVTKSKLMDQILATGKISFDDSDRAKERVVTALKKAGVDINERGDITGMSKALETDVAPLEDEEKKEMLTRDKKTDKTKLSGMKKVATEKKIKAVQFWRDVEKIIDGKK